ncbi:MAG: DUF1285 domain-containing protein [Pseudohongiellaceae bacterium]
MVREIKGKGPAPVHLWNPPFCGDIDMLICRDGTWLHEGKPIRRPAMVKLFASILKLEADGCYYLVTPVEKVRIKVADCPFVITAMTVSGVGQDQLIQFTTNTEESVDVNRDHPISIGSQLDDDEPHPTVEVREGLLGLLSRAVFYSLVEVAVEWKGKLGVWSGGVFFSFDPADRANS